MPLNRLIENSGGYAGFADNCHTPVKEKPLQTPRGLQGNSSWLAGALLNFKEDTKILR